MFFLVHASYVLFFIVRLDSDLSCCRFRELFRETMTYKYNYDSYNDFDDPLLDEEEQLGRKHEVKLRLLFLIIKSILYISIMSV